MTARYRRRSMSSLSSFPRTSRSFRRSNTFTKDNMSTMSLGSSFMDFERDRIPPWEEAKIILGLGDESHATFDKLLSLMDAGGLTVPVDQLKQAFQLAGGDLKPTAKGLPVKSVWQLLRNEIIEETPSKTDIATSEDRINISSSRLRTGETEELEAQAKKKGKGEEKTNSERKGDSKRPSSGESRRKFAQGTARRESSREKAKESKNSHAEGADKKESPDAERVPKSHPWIPSESFSVLKRTAEKITDDNPTSNGRMTQSSSLDSSNQNIMQFDASGDSHSNNESFEKKSDGGEKRNRVEAGGTESNRRRANKDKHHMPKLNSFQSFIGTRTLSEDQVELDGEDHFEGDDEEYRPRWKCRHYSVEAIFRRWATGNRSEKTMSRHGFIGFLKENARWIRKEAALDLFDVCEHRGVLTLLSFGRVVKHMYQISSSNLRIRYHAANIKKVYEKIMKEQTMESASDLSISLDRWYGCNLPESRLKKLIKVFGNSRRKTAITFDVFEIAVRESLRKEAPPDENDTTFQGTLNGTSMTFASEREQFGSMDQDKMDSHTDTMMSEDLTKGISNVKPPLRGLRRRSSSDLWQSAKLNTKDIRNTANSLGMSGYLSQQTQDPASMEQYRTDISNSTNASDVRGSVRHGSVKLRIGDSPTCLRARRLGDSTHNPEQTKQVKHLSQQLSSMARAAETTAKQLMDAKRELQMQRKKALDLEREASRRSRELTKLKTQERTKSEKLDRIQQKFQLEKLRARELEDELWEHAEEKIETKNRSGSRTQRTHSESSMTTENDPSRVRIESPAGRRKGKESQSSQISAEMKLLQEENRQMREMLMKLSQQQSAILQQQQAAMEAAALQQQQQSVLRDRLGESEKNQTGSENGNPGFLPKPQQTQTLRPSPKNNMLQLSQKDVKSSSAFVREDRSIVSETSDFFAVTPDTVSVATSNNVSPTSTLRIIPPLSQKDIEKAKLNSQGSTPNSAEAEPSKSLSCDSMKSEKDYSSFVETYGGRSLSRQGRDGTASIRKQMMTLSAKLNQKAFKGMNAKANKSSRKGSPVKDIANKSGTNEKKHSKETEKLGSNSRTSENLKGTNESVRSRNLGSSNQYESREELLGHSKNRMNSSTHCKVANGKSKSSESILGKDKLVNPPPQPKQKDESKIGSCSCKCSVM